MKNVAESQRQVRAWLRELAPLLATQAELPSDQLLSPAVLTATRDGLANMVRQFAAVHQGVHGTPMPPPACKWEGFLPICDMPEEFRDGRFVGLWDERRPEPPCICYYVVGRHAWQGAGLAAPAPQHVTHYRPAA